MLKKWNLKQDDQGKDYKGLARALKKLGRARLMRTVSRGETVSEYIQHGICDLVQRGDWCSLSCTWINGDWWLTSEVEAWHEEDDGRIIIHTTNSTYEIKET